MSTLIDKIYYCPEGKIVFDAYGKEYPIKKDKRWEFINVNGSKIGVSKLKERIRIRDFDDVVFHWIFSGWFYLYPCPAIELLVNKKLKQEQKKQCVR